MTSFDDSRTQRGVRGYTRLSGWDKDVPGCTCPEVKAGTW